MCVMSLLNRCRDRPCFSKPVLQQVKPTGGCLHGVMLMAADEAMSSPSRCLLLWHRPWQDLGTEGQEQSSLQGVTEVGQG